MRSRRCSSNASPMTPGNSPARRAGSGWGRLRREGGSVELLESLGGGRWRILLRGAPHGAAPAALHPRAARRPRALPDGLRDRDGLGRSADRGRPTSRPSCSRGSRTSGSRSTSGWTRSGRSRPRRSRRTSSTASGIASRRPPGSGSRRPSRCSPSGRRRPVSGDRRAADRSRPVRPLHHAGVSVPSGRRAADQLPSASHDALALVMAFAGVERTREIRPRDPRAVPLLLFRRRDADPCDGAVSCFTARGDRRRRPRRRHPDRARREIRTPAFMPVGTKGTVKTLLPAEVRAPSART